MGHNVSAENIHRQHAVKESRASKPRTSSTSTAPPSRYHHGYLRRALIDAALAMVIEEGAWDFKLREVARRAGVSHAAPYNHFEDKAALLAEVASLGFHSLRLAMHAAARSQPRSARQAFVNIGAAYVRFGVEHPAHYRLMFGVELADRERHPMLHAASDATFAVLTGVLERGQLSGQIRRGEVRDQALAAWALVHGLTTLVIDQRVSFLGVSPRDAERRARQAAMAMLDGLRPKAS
jgi:AcrR family transcriptional regulator